MQKGLPIRNSRPAGKEWLSKLGAAHDRRLPRLEFHVHTNWTDGNNSVQEMYEEACRKNIECILFSEHARKCSRDWFLKFAEEVRILPCNPCTALVGIEARVVDCEGSIAIEDDILELCDLVVGSVHRFPDKDGKPVPFRTIAPPQVLDIESRLSLALLDNPKIDILGHPFGMSYKLFGVSPSPEQMEELIHKAAKNKVAFEINPKYHPDPQALFIRCAKVGCLVSIGSDAHGVQEVGHAWSCLVGD